MYVGVWNGAANRRPRFAAIVTDTRAVDFQAYPHIPGIHRVDGNTRDARHTHGFTVLDDRDRPPLSTHATIL
jgi:hypothetical protein